MISEGWPSCAQICDRAAALPAFGGVEVQQPQQPGDAVVRHLAEKREVEQVAVVQQRRRFGNRAAPAWVGAIPSISSALGVMPMPKAAPSDDWRTASHNRSTDDPTAGCSGG